MIAKLFGVVDSIFVDRLIVNVNGVGYSVLCSKKTIENISTCQNITLWIEHIIRPENQQLCGFLSYDEQLWFREIISVQGVGVKATLSLLSTLSIAEIHDAIINRHKEVLTQADGIGPKAAERIINELKNSKKLTNLTQSFAPISSHQSRQNDVVSALSNLGYDKNEASKIIKLIYSDDLTTQDLIKIALARLSKV